MEVLWCGRPPGARRDGWAFPRAVRDLLVRECEGMTVLHLFGGKADFGLRMDIDPHTRPHVVGDAWLPPFRRDSFDCVVLDPPYTGAFRGLNAQNKYALFAAAAWIARRRLVWFHPMWVHHEAGCRLERAWLVRVGRNCVVRALQFLEVPERKRPPVTHFTRGPAIRYNKWLVQPERLPFGEGGITV